MFFSYPKSDIMLWHVKLSCHVWLWYNTRQFDRQIWYDTITWRDSLFFKHELVSRFLQEIHARNLFIQHLFFSCRLSSWPFSDGLKWIVPDSPAMIALYVLTIILLITGSSYCHAENKPALYRNGERLLQKWLYYTPLMFIRIGQIWLSSPAFHNFEKKKKEKFW